MRCSSCEPLLDAFLEGTLQRRRGAQVARHLRVCSDCTALLHELRVTDALLTTARSPGSIGNDITAAVVSATRDALPPPPRRIALWPALLAYLLVAWISTAVFALQSNAPWLFIGGLFTSERHGLAAVSAAARALAPATPLAAAAMSGVLLLDLLLLSALFYGYRRFRGSPS